MARIGRARANLGIAHLDLGTTNLDLDGWLGLPRPDGLLGVGNQAHAEKERGGRAIAERSCSTSGNTPVRQGDRTRNEAGSAVSVGEPRRPQSSQPLRGKQLPRLNVARGSGVIDVRAKKTGPWEGGLALRRKCFGPQDQRLHGRCNIQGLPSLAATARGVLSSWANSAQLRRRLTFNYWGHGGITGAQTKYCIQYGVRGIE